MTSDEQSLSNHSDFESSSYRLAGLVSTRLKHRLRDIIGQYLAERNRLEGGSGSSHGTRLQRRNYSLFTVCSRPNTLSVVAVLPGLGLCSTNRMPFRVFEPTPLRLPTVSEPTFLSVTNRNERERE